MHLYRDQFMDRAPDAQSLRYHHVDVDILPEMFDCHLRTRKIDDLDLHQTEFRFEILRMDFVKPPSRSSIERDDPPIRTRASRQMQASRT